MSVTKMKRCDIHEVCYNENAGCPFCLGISKPMHQTATGAVRSCEYSGGEGRPEKNRIDLLFKNREALETYGEAYARGMRKYGRDNWLKGFKESVLVQHALDHLLHYVNGTCDPGEEDVDQLSGVLWNIGTLCWVRKHKPELLDLSGPDPGPEEVEDKLQKMREEVRDKVTVEELYKTPTKRQDPRTNQV